VFGGFSAESLSDRIVDSTCQVVITSNGSFRGAKAIPQKATPTKPSSPPKRK